MCWRATMSSSCKRGTTTEVADPLEQRHDREMDIVTFARRWTLADLFELPDSPNRCEVIDGNLIVSPPPEHWRVCPEFG